MLTSFHDVTSMQHTDENSVELSRAWESSCGPDEPRQAIRTPSCPRLCEQLRCEYTRSVHVQRIPAPHFMQSTATQCDLAEHRMSEHNMKHVEGSLLRVLKQVEEAVGPLRRWAMSEAEPVCMSACTRLQKEMQCEHKHAVVRTADSSCGRTGEHVHHTTGSPTAGSHTAPQADAARANHDKG